MSVFTSMFHKGTGSASPTSSPEARKMTGTKVSIGKKGDTQETIALSEPLFSAEPADIVTAVEGEKVGLLKVSGKIEGDHATVSPSRAYTPKALGHALREAFGIKASLKAAS